MNRFNELDDFMRQTDSDLIVGSRKMYFDDGEWHDLRADRRDVSDYPSGGRRGYQAAKAALDKIGGVNIIHINQ